MTDGNGTKYEGPDYIYVNQVLRLIVPVRTVYSVIVRIAVARIFSEINSSSCMMVYTIGEKFVVDGEATVMLLSKG